MISNPSTRLQVQMYFYQATETDFSEFSAICNGNLMEFTTKYAVCFQRVSSSNATPEPGELSHLCSRVPVPVNGRNASAILNLLRCVTQSNERFWLFWCLRGS